MRSRVGSSGKVLSTTGRRGARVRAQAQTSGHTCRSGTIPLEDRSEHPSNLLRRL